MAKSDLIHLKSDGVSVLIDTASGTPVVLHWGREISGTIDAAGLRSSQIEPTPHCDFDEPQAAGIYRENARGFLGRPALAGSRNGLDWSQKFDLVSSEQPDANSVVLTSRDETAGLELVASFALSPQGILNVEYKLTNLGQSDFAVDELSVWLPVPDYVGESLDFTGRWMNERQPQRQPIRSGQWVREGREGRTGHDYTLVQFALTEETSFESGEAWGLSLAWSGNNRHIIEKTPIGRTSIAAGELLLPGEVVLSPGESYSTPRVVAVYASDGIDGASARFHRELRAREAHPTNKKPRPVTLNVWEAVYFDHNLEKLAELAEVAAAIGVERFVLDDGWFGSRRNDLSGLGDWVVSPDVWPNGLGPLVDKVKSLGLEFGLWFEGEMVNEDSDLYRAHPEWILHAGGRVPPTFRNQQVLDLTHEGAFDHVFSQTSALISEHKIDYIKWDHNRVLTEAAHLGRPAVHAQTEAIYRMFDELKAAHPGLEIESCASGGGRIDLGMVEHADRFWTSDNNDSLERQSIQRYTSIVIPPELLGTHIGPTTAHSSGRTLELSFRAATALWGHAGLEWDLTQASEDERKLLASWIDYYKAKRGLLHSGRVVRVNQSEPNGWVHGVVAQDQSEAVFALVQLRPSQFSRPANVRLTGLQPDATYEVRVVETAGPAKAMQIIEPRWYQGVRLTGELLATVGLRAPVLRPEQAMLIEVKIV